MHDVIVIGAGFAGCAAAREVRRAGKSPIIIEARDRIGGRTWTADWDGRTYERGGNFFHWFQPHAWTEIMAAGCTPMVLPTPMRASRLVGGEVHAADVEEHDAIIESAWAKYNADSWRIMPLPHDPLSPLNDIARLDGMTIAERIAELDLTPDEHGVLMGECEGLASGYADDAGALSVLRWHALCGHNLLSTQQASGGDIAITEGTIGFLQPILDEAACDVALETPIAAIEQDGDRVVVTTRAGEAIVGRTVVVTIPLNVLGDIAFEPGFSEAKQAGIAQGHAGIGSKAMFKVRGLDETVVALAEDHPFGWFTTLFDDGDEQTLVAFGRDGADVRDDLEWAQHEIGRVFPEATVVELSYHDWKADEFAQGTWAIHRPGWYANHHAAMQEPEGRVILASADIADGWAGFVDGALESGKRGGRWAAAQV
jgi:monoamine oxidase